MEYTPHNGLVELRDTWLRLDAIQAVQTFWSDEDVLEGKLTGAKVWLPGGPIMLDAQEAGVLIEALES